MKLKRLLATRRDGVARRAQGNRLRTLRRRVRKCYLALLCLPKTLFFNLYYFPVPVALRFPVIVSHRVWLMELGGHITFGPRPHLGMVRIGFGSVGIFDQARSRSIWEVRGHVHFEGRCSLGHGTKLAVDNDALLSFGEKTCVTAETAICCSREVTIGHGTLISWDVLIMDSDFHRIEGRTGERLNDDAPVVVGDRVWLGCRATVLKGAKIASGSIIAAGSIVTATTTAEPNALLAGIPARPLRHDMMWRT